MLRPPAWYPARMRRRHCDIAVLLLTLPDYSMLTFGTDCARRTSL